ncbi:glycosyltransferase family 4 protein [Allocoleopsis sp.]|uniref:glycosyltransferase family 4 protein n=1 Tax=Allocoleopsis sp. TaxID=3088169 RepID=UPI002FD43A97
MKIAVIGAKGLPAKQGGIEHHCQEIYPRLVAKGHSVDLFARSSYTGDISLHHYQVEGVRVVSLPCLNLKGMDALLTAALGAIASSGTCYDIIHFHAVGPALFTWLPKIASTAKIVVTCHGLDWQRSKWSKASSYLLRLGERAAVRFADRIIVVSEELRSYFKQTYGEEEALYYIPNAPSKLSESDPNFAYGSSLGLTQGRYIVFLGRLVPEKCPDLLIKAFKSIQAQGWKLALVGGSSDTPEFTTQLRNLAENSPDIIFTNELQGARLAEIIRGAGLFVLPSEIEGLPLAMLEAMQEGIPVVASNLPVHQQLVGHNRGMLFPVGDVDSCKQRLDWGIHHLQELAEMAQNAQKHIKDNYNWDKITNDMLGLYTELLPAPPLPDLQDNPTQNSPLIGIANTKVSS